MLFKYKLPLQECWSVRCDESPKNNAEERKLGTPASFGIEKREASKTDIFAHHTQVTASNFSSFMI